MSESHEGSFRGQERPPNELTPDQGELLVEELKRFEPYLDPVATWFDDLEPRPGEAVYEVGEIEVRLIRIEGNGIEDIAAGWSVSWLEDLRQDMTQDIVAKAEHRHRISVTTGGQVPYSSYERIDWMADHETGRLERVQSPREREAIEAFHAEEDAGAAIGLLIESIFTEGDKAREMERLTGIDARGFNAARFDKVMALLSEIDPANKKLQ